MLNTGTRAEVTGGRHLDELQALLIRVFIDAGIPPGLIDVRKRPIVGYFRRDKSWDVVVMVANRVVGIIELKPMAGDSPGQNFNNRTDEALGQSLAVWTAVERGIIDTPLRPWLGYFMLLEDNTAFNTPVHERRPVWNQIRCSPGRHTPTAMPSSSTGWSVNAFLIRPACSWLTALLV